jgi:uncharacterized protein YbaR (Trm112 family)
MSRSSLAAQLLLIQSRLRLTPPMTEALLSILRCPVTKQPLRLLAMEEKAQRGIPVEEPALVTQDGARVYRAVNGMPVLLPPAMVEEEVSTG